MREQDFPVKKRIDVRRDEQLGRYSANLNSAERENLINCKGEPHTHCGSGDIHEHVGRGRNTIVAKELIELDGN